LLIIYSWCQVLIKGNIILERRVFMEPKRLYRSVRNKMICGVCQGIAEYINLDPTIVRLLWVLLSLWGGVGIILYIAAAIIMPVKPE